MVKKIAILVGVLSLLLVCVFAFSMVFCFDAVDVYSCLFF